MTDYKKWDRMAAMLDEEGSDEDASVQERQQRPFSSTRTGPVRVTRMDAASTVTIGQDGGLVIGGPSCAAKDSMSSPLTVGGSSACGSQDLVQSKSCKATGGLDYSKWDKLAFDESDSDQEMEEDEFAHADIVEEAHVDAGSAAAGAGRGGGAQDKGATGGGREGKRAAAGLAGLAAEQELTRNGGATGTYLWSQDIKEVVIRVLAPADTRASQVEVRLSKTRVSVKVRGEPLVDGELAYPVHVAADGDDYDLDWEVMNLPPPDGRRAVRLTMLKALPGSESLPALPRSDALVIWWKSVVKGDAEIDVSSIPDRRGGKPGLDASLHVWKEAHQRFRDKIRQQEPIVL